jgi:hypothetical protein
MFSYPLLLVILFCINVVNRDKPAARAEKKRDTNLAVMNAVSGHLLPGEFYHGTSKLATVIF